MEPGQEPAPPTLPSPADQEHEQALADLDEKDMQLDCEENAAEESRRQPLTVAGFEAALAEKGSASMCHYPCEVGVFFGRLCRPEPYRGHSARCSGPL